MNFSEEQVTAYALGEATPEEAAAIEQALRDDPQIKQQVEDIRATATLLSSAFGEEPSIATPELPPADIEQTPKFVHQQNYDEEEPLEWSSPIIRKYKEEEKYNKPQKMKMIYFISIGAAAASFLLAALLTLQVFKHNDQKRAALAANEQRPIERFQYEPEADLGPPPDPRELELEIALSELKVAEEMLLAANDESRQLSLDDSSELSLDSLDIALSPREADAKISIAGESNFQYDTPAQLMAKNELPEMQAPNVELDEADGLITGSPTVTSSPQHEPTYDLFAPLPSQKIQQVAQRIKSPGVFGGGSVNRSEVLFETITAPSAESYDPITGNTFKAVLEEPLSTFSIDVDTASYANVRRYLRQGQLPPRDAVRVEELINYFPYEYPAARSQEEPLKVIVDAAPAPWEPQHKLVRVAMKGYEMPWSERPQSNLVFLIDKSGSMSSANKLPLVQESLAMLARKLDERDRIGIVTYASGAGVALPSTSVGEQQRIIDAVMALGAGGSTNGAGGIKEAYRMAREHFIEGANNRVILCTDGDFNVGTTDREDLRELIEREAKSGVFLSVFGFGMGNLKDGMLEDLSNRGNGNYGYIDSATEARKVFVEGAAGTLLTIAKDVKLQVEFNPANVQSYRLIGYENRMLAAEDFNDDKKDAGEVGAGHTVTALYEVVPVGVQTSAARSPVDELKYQQPTEDELTLQESTAAMNNLAQNAVLTGEMLTVKLRYKMPEATESVRREFPFSMARVEPDFLNAPEDFRFATSVAAFGILLRDGDNMGDMTLSDVSEIASEALGEDSSGYRAEFLNLVDRARALSR